MRVKHYQSLLWLSHWHHGRAEYLQRLHESHLQTLHQLVLDHIDGVEYERATLNFSGISVTLHCDLLEPQLVSISKPAKRDSFQKELMLAGCDAAFCKGAARITKLRAARKRLSAYLLPSELEALLAKWEEARRGEEAAHKLAVPLAYSMQSGYGYFFPIAARKDLQRRDIQLYGLLSQYHFHHLTTTWLSDVMGLGRGYSRGEGERIESWEAVPLQAILDRLEQEQEVEEAEHETAA